MRERSRRAILTGSLAAVIPFAGCGGDSAGGTPTQGTLTEPATEPSDTMSTPTDDLDLREANVTDVTVEDTGGGTYRFSVTLYHDDDGEDAYANWWQVETLDGTQLGRRELLHAHSTAPFTRSETVEVPDDVDCVVVRGHDQTHEYGGQAAIVTVRTGATRFVQQGSGSQAFEDAACP